MNISPLEIKDSPKAAKLHQKAFSKGWKEGVFQEFLQNPLTFGIKIEENQGLSGYVLWRKIADEAEILTLVVDRSRRRKGVASFLITHLCTTLKETGVTRLFLEVAEDNIEGISFYRHHGFVFLSKRPRYYPRDADGYISALNFVKDLI